MRHIFVRVTLFFLITILTATSLVAGAKVTILLQNGKQITGELLAVRDTRFIIATDLDRHEVVLRDHPDKILVVAKEDVQSFTICARSYIFNGIAVGLAGGVLIGMLVSYEPRGWETHKTTFDPDGPGPNAIIFCSAGGAALGALAGGTAATEAYNIDMDGKRFLDSLRQLARYKEYEPEFIKRLLPVNIGE